MTSAEQHFRTVAPRWMGLLRADFDLSDLDVAAVFGNLGHESKGLTDDQEDAPLVNGSRGGRNWAQWTGPRRRAFKAYCTRSRKDPDSDEAAYAFMFVELKTTEKHALAALRAATTLEDKVVAFEKAFLRAGIKHYPSRQQWARVALDAYRRAGSPIGEFTKATEPPLPKPPIVRPGAPAGGSGAVAVGLGAAALLGLPWWAWLLFLIAAAAAGWFLWPRRHAIATHIRLLTGKL